MFQEDWLRGSIWAKGYSAEGKASYFYKSFLVLSSKAEKRPEQDLELKRCDPPGFKATFLGKEFTFVQKPEEWLECTICEQLSDKPNQIPCCGGQTICGRCAEEWKKRNDSCPHCRKSPFETMPDVRGERFINNLQTYCPNYTHGCDWKGDLKSVKEHVTTHCGYTVKPCPLGCELELMAKQCDRHTERECKFRKFSCPQCNQSEGLTYDSFTRKHYKECPSWPLICPNECEASLQSGSPILRSAVEEHLEVCVEQTVQCALGCGKQIKRKDMSRHIAAEKDTHIHCLQERLLQVEEENKELKKTIEELKASNQQLKEKYTYNVFD